MLESKLRHHYQYFLVDRIAKRLADVVTPNEVTLASLGAGLCAAGMIAVEWYWIAAIMLLLSGYLDTLDGTIARITNNSSSYGAMLDILCDRMVECAVVFSFFAIAPDERGWVCLLMMGGILIVVTSFLVAGIFISNDSEKSFNYTPSLMERAEAFLFFLAMMIWPDWFTLLGILFTTLVLYTAWVRCKETRKILEEQV